MTANIQKSLEILKTTFSCRLFLSKMMFMRYFFILFAIADGTQYGLCGAVFGPHEAAVNFARRMRTGNVYVNDASRDLAAPFGGFKSSGVGREGGVFGLLEFTEPKAIFEHGS